MRGVMTNVSSDALLVFQLGEQQFAVAVASVERVVRAVEIAPLPEAPRGVRGVINLEKSGRIVLLLDPVELLTQAERGLLDTFQAETGRTEA